MIRSWEDAQEKLAKALEVLISCAVFGAGIWIALEVPAVSGVWRFVTPIVALLLAVIFPVLVYGRPRYHLKWKILTETADGIAVVDLGKAPTPLGTPEVSVCIDLRVQANSIWARYLRRKARAQGVVEVWVEILPPGAADLKGHHDARGGARVETVSDDQGSSPLLRQYMVMPVTSDSEKADQSRFVGSLMPQALVSRSEDLAVSASLRTVSRKSAHKNRKLRDADLGVHTIRVRS